jgi:hypothetical protein
MAIVYIFVRFAGVEPKAPGEPIADTNKYIIVFQSEFVPPVIEQSTLGGNSFYM